MGEERDRGKKEKNKREDEVSTTEDPSEAEEKEKGTTDKHADAAKEIFQEQLSAQAIVTQASEASASIAAPTPVVPKVGGVVTAVEERTTEDPHASAADEGDTDTTEEVTEDEEAQ